MLFFFVQVIFLIVLKIRENYMPFYEGKDIALSLLYFLRKETPLMARSTRLESGFQDKLKNELEEKFPGCMIFKMDQMQGIPDLLILYKDKWASLECKRGTRSKKQPNQDYYVNLMDDMSFSRFVNKDNKEEVLRDLEQTFRP